MATRVEYELRDETMWITFRETEERRPCTLDYEVMDQLDAATDAAADDPSVRAVVVQSASPKFFVVGANINFLETLTPDGMMPWVERGYKSFGRFQELPTPVIASVAGAALGGGLELALSCDFIIAGENARFACPEASLGVMTGWGGSYRLPKLVGAPMAKEMYFTGQTLTAREAKDIGLVNHVTPAEELTAYVTEMVANIRKNDALAIRLAKEIMNNHIYDRVGQSLQSEAVNSVVCMHSPTTKKRMADFFASRKKK